MSSDSKQTNGDVEITPEMVQAGMDFAADLGVENVSLDTLARGLFQTMVLASHGQHRDSFVRMHRVHQQETDS